MRTGGTIPLSPALIAEKVALWLTAEGYARVTARTTTAGLPCVVVPGSAFRSAKERHRVHQCAHAFGFLGSLTFTHPAAGWTVITLHHQPLEAATPPTPLAPHA